MNYEKRLLKELKEHNHGLFTSADFAGFWKRSKIDVATAALNLFHNCMINIGPNGGLTLKDGIGGA